MQRQSRQAGWQAGTQAASWFVTKINAQCLLQHDSRRDITISKAGCQQRCGRRRCKWQAVGQAQTTARPTFQPQSWISTPGHKLPLSSRRGQMKACTPWSSRAPLPSGEGTCGRAGRQAEGREGRRVRVRRCSRMQSAGQKAPAPLPVSSAPVPALTAVPPAQLHCSSTRLEAGKHCGHLAVLCGIADPPLDSAVIRGVDDPLISVHI